MNMFLNVDLSVSFNFTYSCVIWIQHTDITVNSYLICWYFQVLVEKPSREEKKTYRSLIIGEDEASSGKLFMWIGENF